MADRERADPSAHAVVENLLERTGTALLNDDFPTFAACYIYPQEMVTFNGRRPVRNVEEMRHIFGNLRSFLEAENIVDMVRRCIAAEFRDADTISATHDTRLLRRGAILAYGPFPVLTRIVREEGLWKVASSQYAIEDAEDAPGTLGT